MYKFKKGDRAVITVSTKGHKGEIVTIGELRPGYGYSDHWEVTIDGNPDPWCPTHQIKHYAAASVLRPINIYDTKEESTMSNYYTSTEEAKALKLSVDDQMLFNMQLINLDGELTSEGKNFMNVVAYEAHKDEMVAKAKAVLAARQPVATPAATE